MDKGYGSFETNGLGFGAERRLAEGCLLLH